MKKKITVIIMLYTILLSLSCTKSSDDNTNNDTKPTIKITRSLNNLSLDSTKYFLHGNWKLVALSGGFGGPGVINYYTDRFFNIDTLNLKRQLITSTTQENTNIRFEKKKKPYYLGTDSFWVFTPYSNTVNPSPVGVSVFPYQYKNDTLILREFNIHGQDIHLIKF